LFIKNLLRALFRYCAAAAAASSLKFFLCLLTVEFVSRILAPVLPEFISCPPLLQRIFPSEPAPPFSAHFVSPRPLAVPVPVAIAIADADDATLSTLAPTFVFVYLPSLPHALLVLSPDKPLVARGVLDDRECGSWADLHSGFSTVHSVFLLHLLYASVFHHF
jgi:hypothetical protein